MQNYRRGSILTGINDHRSEERTSITTTSNAKFAKVLVCLVGLLQWCN